MSGAAILAYIQGRFAGSILDRPDVRQTVLDS